MSTIEPPLKRTCLRRGAGNRVQHGWIGADAPPTPAPPLQASAPGSAVDYPLTDLTLDTNYTATVRGLRGPNFTSPASITFTTGIARAACGSQEIEGNRYGPHFCLLPSFPLPGLKPPQDLEAKEVTPRTALLTWTAPEVAPTGYLLSFDTPGGQIQVPHFTGSRLSAARFGGATSGSPRESPSRPLLTCPSSVPRKSCFQQEPPRTGFSASFPPPSTAPSSGLFGARASHRLCPLPLLLVLALGCELQGTAGV